MTVYSFGTLLHHFLLLQHMKHFLLIFMLSLAHAVYASGIPIVNEPTRETAINSYIEVLIKRHPSSESVDMFPNPSFGYTEVFEVIYPSGSDTLSQYYQLGLSYADTSESWIGQEAWVGTAFESVDRIQFPKDVFGSLFHEAQQEKTEILRALIPEEGFEVLQVTGVRDMEEPDERTYFISADTVTYRDLGFDFFTPSVLQIDFFVDTRFSESGTGKISVFGGGFSEVLLLRYTEGQVFLISRQASDH